ncbi:MAG: hypothetical protein ABI072_10575 [Edaphobacter sp.]
MVRFGEEEGDIFVMVARSRSPRIVSSTRPRKCYDSKMVLRSAASIFLLLCCSVAFPQTPASHGPRTFHDSALGITYFFPSRFTQVKAEPAKSEAQQECARTSLSGSSVTPVGTSAFVVSTIDKACPAVLQAATQKLDAFTREQVLRQLKQYGDPVITHDPTRYMVDGHPAAITIASVQQSSTGVNNVIHPKMTYAAKACVLGEVPVKGDKSRLAEETRHILCFDFTTHQRDLLPLMLAFTMQFDGRSPQPIVPGSVLR